jgi:hypothetical protein
MSSITQVRRGIDPVSIIVRVCSAIALTTIGFFFTPLPGLKVFSSSSFDRYFEFIFWTLVLVRIGGALVQLVRLRVLGARTVIVDLISAFLPPIGYLGFLMHMGH